MKILAENKNLRVCQFDDSDLSTPLPSGKTLVEIQWATEEQEDQPFGPGEEMVLSYEDAATCATAFNKLSEEMLNRSPCT